MSYADLMTLLFAFFTVMYAASSVDATKLGPLASSIELAFAGSDASSPRPIGARPTIVPRVEVVPTEKESNLDGLRLRLTQELDEDVRAHNVEITRDERGLVMSLPEQATFAVGSAEVTDETRQLIERVVRPVLPLANAIRIEGHTDDVPIRTPRFESNWELSSARASAVIVLLVQGTGVQPARLSAAGYGEFHPRVANDSPGGRARNRRIDIVILDFAGPGPDGAR